jgi:hypothetical protein
MGSSAIQERRYGKIRDMLVQKGKGGGEGCRAVTHLSCVIKKNAKQVIAENMRGHRQ